MCGISGYFGNFAPNLLNTFVKALHHRGPDGDGQWHADGVGLAHNRLSIIDLSTAASQPMQACDGRYTVVFNGEIYNFQTLVPILQKAGYNFNPNSDTAVLAPLYDHYGLDSLNQLQGMFAIGLYNAQRDELLLMRDHAGIKPIYYAHTTKGLVFASELKALAAVADEAGVDLTPDATALQEYVSFLWTPGTRTPVQGIRKLRPGHWLKATRQADGSVSVTITRWYWPPLHQPHAAEPSPTTHQLAKAWDAIVAEQCTADVPLGAFLSGGVDSSAIVASMVATGHTPQHTYCIGFTGAGMAGEGFDDDAHFAKAMAQHAGVPLQVLNVDVDATLAKLPTLAWQLDEPTADPAPLLVTAISQQARRDGLKVLMSGTGGDDVLTGYRRHQSARLREYAGRCSAVPGGLAGALAPLVKGALRRRLDRLAGLMGGSDETFLLNAFLTNSQPDAHQLVRLPDGAPADAWGRELRTAIGESAGQSLVNRLLLAEGAGFLPDHNLNYGDKAGMAAGIEIRVPFTDRRLADFMARVPPHQKMRGLNAKSFFKQAMQGRVPSSVLNRRKTGFGAPLRSWLIGPGKPLVDDLLTQADATLFQSSHVRGLWHATQQGSRDGAYTLLAVAMVHWWFASLKQR
jgi:asparagine synthase (glutamine-hydrolysing)